MTALYKESYITVYLGIGTNLGDRLHNIQSAINLLNRGEECKVEAVSSVYQSKAWGVEDQPDFLNAAVKIRTILFPDALLRFVKNIEKEIGREKTFRWGPRVIDIDILLYGDEIIKETELIIPHKEMTSRLFVILPMIDLAPELIIPGIHKSISQILPDLEDQKNSISIYGE